VSRFINLKIDNSEEAAIKSGTWKDPGAKLYDKLLGSHYFDDTDNNDGYETANNPNNKSWQDFLKETYLIAPVNKIKNSPHGVTPYSRSGCKYPHHTIRGDKLVLSKPGVVAAYKRAKQQGIFSRDVKEHLERHYKELQIYEDSTMSISERIDFNFEDINSYLTESYQPEVPEEFQKILNSLEGVRFGRSESEITVSSGKYKGIKATIISEAMCKSRKNLTYQFKEQDHRFYSKPGKEQYTWEWFAVPYGKAITEATEDPPPDIPEEEESVDEDADIEEKEKPVDVTTAVLNRVRQKEEEKEVPPEEIPEEIPPEVEEVPEDPEPVVEEPVEVEKIEEPPSLEGESRPKQTDRDESPKNGVKRKALYIEFIEYSKRLRPKNTFGSVFDQDAFDLTYPFVPDEMRYFYRLANPLLCVLEDDLTFFALSELKKVNPRNDFKKFLLFAASANEVIFFAITDKAVYKTAEKYNDLLKKNNVTEGADKLASTFDTYIENIVGVQML